MNPDDIPNDELFQLEWKIAQRADALSRQAGGDPKRALAHWQQAEHEVWDALSGGSAPVTNTQIQVAVPAELAACAL